jgi:1A family penicillin-binding protein
MRYTAASRVRPPELQNIAEKQAIAWHTRCCAYSTRMRAPDWNRLGATVNARRPLFLGAAVAVFLCVWGVFGASLWYLHAATRDLPDQAAVRAAGTMARATTIADVKGRHAFTIFEERRLQVPLSRISPNLIRAIIAVEDRRFYDHGGIDPIRVARAAVHDLMKYRREQGGSTITQQLARLSLLSSEKTITRKLQEVALATRFERHFTKDQILELYLNKAYFGDGLYGVEAASLGYFGRHASELSVAEAALIAGLVKSPSAYAPTANPKRAVARRNVVLRAMQRAGAIDAATCEAAIRSPLRLKDTLRGEEAYGQYFKEEVRKQLVQMFGWDRVYRAGLRVETTLDLDMQKAADAEVARALAEIEKRQARRRTRAADTTAEAALQAALIAIDPRTGEVRAMVGGRGFDASRFNRATQSRRQPGSAFKPFVYAAALEQGYTPATVLTGLSNPIMTASGAWVPEDGHLESDAITMRAALRISSNRAAVRMLEAVGIPAAVQYASRLGIGDMPQVPSLALGSGDVTLQSMTSAFGAFANGGRLAVPSLIRRVVTSDGEVLYQAAAVVKPVVSPATAFLITSMLQDVVNHGTAWQARRIGFRLPAAGKTGTTNEYRDAWFVGYTTNLVTGVWVGYDQPRTIVRGGYAAELAVPLWARFMMTATRHDKPEWFRAPSTVTTAEICRLSGRLATDSCRRSGDNMTYTEYFARETVPSDVCLLHRFDLLRDPHLAHTDPAPLQPEVVAAAVAPAPVSTAEQLVIPAAAPPEPEKQKKRGFWTRLFKGDEKKPNKNK